MVKLQYKEAVEFFKCTRSRSEFEDKFGLSNVESSHYTQGMIKRGDLEMIRVWSEDPNTKTRGRKFVYKTTPRGEQNESSCEYNDTL
jgi:hypothetical protein